MTYEPVIKAMAEKGLTLSFVYGLSNLSTGPRIFWSVNVLRVVAGATQEFATTFAADSFEQAVEIAELEATKLGWLE